MAQIRPAYTKRGPTYTQMGCSIRCVKKDATSSTNVLHYLTGGLINFRFALRRQEFFIPAGVLLKALIDTTDRSVYESLVQGDQANTFLTNHTELLLREAQKFVPGGRYECLAFLGERFRILMTVPDRLTDFQVGEKLLREMVFIHLDNNQDKYNLLIYMIKKLYALVDGKCAEDNPDCMTNQEVLTPGHLMAMFTKEKLDEALEGMKNLMRKDERTSFKGYDLNDSNYFKRCLERTNIEVGKKMEYLLNTGNLISQSGLDLMQVSGYTILAEKLNYLRYLSHFRCIHRGQFFMEMKTTTVRKLLPETWGFLCPVHTPDGSPCGLLNHLASKCIIQTEDPPEDLFPKMANFLATLGMMPASGRVVAPSSFLPVILDGQVMGHIEPRFAANCVGAIREGKVMGRLPKLLEAALVMPIDRGQFPGLYLHATPSRMMRPVRQLKTNLVEWIGSFEQSYMSVACMDEDIVPGKTTHQEVSPMHIISEVASMTPFSDFNQSPRNMYQCQMGKQAMASPYHSYPFRVDNKVYRIQTPQIPIVRTRFQDEYEMDEYPVGTNAIIALIAYTGYDMEDSVVINKASYERGFMHASVYQSKIIDLEDMRARGAPLTHRFGNYLPGETEKICPSLDDDGLPHVGQLIKKGDPYCCIVDEQKCRSKKECSKSNEVAIVDEVRLLGGTGNAPLSKVILKLRFNRNPTTGDKFASRAGQKGVMSMLWPSQDIPFSESGMQPDLLFNPHGMPSRMTIGKLLEAMAGKAGALHGVWQEATPFCFSEGDRAVDHFGKQLAAAGYHYHGNETLYNGMTGEEIEAEIFMGVVHYQRLRHMVSDKYQVRANGPVNKVHQQPIKGRKLGGGVRFGEMERDSLLAHGCAYLLHDRLMKCSDYSSGHVCTRCGSMLSAVHVPDKTGLGGSKGAPKVKCTALECAGKDSQVELVHMPAVFKFLANELAAMNVRLTVGIGDV